MEKRKVRRRRVFKAAMIEFRGGTFSCVVRNLSESGAHLEVPSQIGIPHEFILKFPAAELHRRAERCGAPTDGLGSLLAQLETLS